jgi:hypothetical protein
MIQGIQTRVDMGVAQNAEIFGKALAIFKKNPEVIKDPSRLSVIMSQEYGDVSFHFTPTELYHVQHTPVGDVTHKWGFTEERNGIHHESYDDIVITLLSMKELQPLYPDLTNAVGIIVGERMLTIVRK